MQQAIKQRNSTCRSIQDDFQLHFFNYFCFPEMPEFWNAIAKIDEHFQLGYFSHNHIILKLVVYFSGEVFADSQ